MTKGVLIVGGERRGKSLVIEAAIERAREQGVEVVYAPDGISGRVPALLIEDEYQHLKLREEHAALARKVEMPEPFEPSNRKARRAAAARSRRRK